MPIKITSKKDGFRRCGIAHPKEATEYPDDRFTKEELTVLDAEKMLVVEIIPGGLGKKEYELNVPKTVELVTAAETIEALDDLAKDETRKGVLDAIEKRRAELTPE